MTATSTAEAGSLRARRDGDDIVVDDRSCGRCPTCAAGFRLWCADPAEGDEVLRATSELDPAAALLALTAAAAFAASSTTPDQVVLALDEATGSGAADPFDLARLLGRVHPGPVLAARDAADPGVRAELARLTELGRADVIVATAQARSAVKAVRRGGTVCLPAAHVDASTVTELVQRELRLVGARDVRGLLESTAGREGL